MSKDITIYYSIKDQASATIMSLVNSGKHLDKALNDNVTNLGNFIKKSDELKNKQAELTRALDDAKKAAKEAGKAYKENGDTLSQIKYEEAIKEAQEYGESLKFIKQEAKDTEKDIRQLNDTLAKQSNRADSDGGLLGGGSGGQLAKGLMSAGLLNQLGGAVQGLANTYISSAFGDVAGDQISGILGSTISGAAMGSIAGIPGALVGGMVGLGAGLIGAETKRVEAEDNAVMGYRNADIDRVNAEYSDRRMLGSNIAASREMVGKSFEGSFGKEGASDFIEELLEKDAENPFNFDDMAAISRTYAGYGFNEEAIYRQLDAIGNVGVSGGMGSQDMQAIANTLGFMEVSPSVNQMQLKTLAQRGIPVTEYIAEAFDIDKDEVYDKLPKLDPKKIAEAILSGIENDPQYMGAMGRAGETYLGKLAMAQAGRDNLNAAMGTGYNDEKLLGLDAEIGFYESKYGVGMGEAYGYMGQWEASLENQKEEMKRGSFAAVMDGTISPEMRKNFSPESIEKLGTLNTEYEQAMAEGNGTEAGRIYKEAEILARAEYNASDGAQLELESQKLLINNATEMLVADKTYWNAGQLLGIELSKGIASTYELPDPSGKSIGSGSSAKTIAQGRTGGDFTPFPSAETPDISAATGLANVPYDGFKVLAHKGEGILNAEENRAYRSGKGGSPLTVTGNNFYIREEADIEKIAKVIVREFVLASKIG